MTNVERVSKEEFERLSKLMMGYLDEWHHPHTTIIITSTRAELVEGLMCATNKKYQDEAR